MSTPTLNPDYINVAWAFYRYPPSLPAAILFCILFLIASAIHGFQVWRTKTWYMLIFLAGGLCKTSRFALALSARPSLPPLFIFSALAYELKSLIVSSRGHRVHRSCQLRCAKAWILDSHSFHHPKYFSARCSCDVRCLNLHDPWPHYSVNRWRQIFLDTPPLDDKAFCRRRHFCIHATRHWYNFCSWARTRLTCNRRRSHSWRRKPLQFG
jgi:hypothetical protein